MKSKIYYLGFFSSLYYRHKDLVGYFIAASCGVIVQYLVGSTLLLNYLGWSAKSGFAWGFIISFPVGFFLTKLLAFDVRHSGKTFNEIFKYTLTVIASGFITVYGAIYSIQLLLSLFGDFKATVPFTDYEFSPAGTIGHFMGMGMSFVFNFFAHKWFTFRSTGLLDKIKSSYNGTEQ